MSPNPEPPNQAIKLLDWDPTERKVVVMLRDQEVVVRRLTDEELESPTRLRDDYYMR